MDIGLFFINVQTTVNSIEIEITKKHVSGWVRFNNIYGISVPCIVMVF